MDELVAAAKAEGQLTTIALPHDWCGYGAVIDGFKAKYPEITINELNPDAGSGDEIEAIKAVPAGKYGKAALETLGVWASVEGKVAQAENVRAALKLVSTGEAPLGIVYKTDAAAEPGVKVVGTFPEDSHPPIIYPVAQTADSKNADAPAFLKCLQSAKAKELFEAQGFTVPGAGRLELREIR